jgi:carbon-monoxide dehydrogenase large subunit
MYNDVMKFSSAKPGNHNELNDFLQGKGQYTSDIDMPGQLHASFVRSPYASALIKKIDTQVATAIPGVSLILTGEDLVKAGVGQISALAMTLFKGTDGKPMRQAGIPVLAFPEVRHVGEAVALVVATDAATAQLAAEQLEISWEVRTPVIDPMQAIQISSPSLYTDCPNNIALDWEDGNKSLSETAFSKAHHIESVELANPPLTACSIEPKAALANWDSSSQRFTLIASTQGVMLVRKILSEQVFNMPPESIRVITPHVGGGFGVKVQTYAEYAAILFASRELNKPVKWTASRLECFLTDTHSRDSTLRARMAFDEKGHILGLEADVVWGIGAYTSTYVGIMATLNFKNCLSSIYRVPSIHARSRLVFTNTTPLGPYRGASRPEAIYIIERLLDKAAETLKIDRVELRRKNLIPVTAMPYTTPNGQIYDSGEFEAVMDKAIALSEWNSFESRRISSERQGKLRGIGMCSFLEHAGGATNTVEEPADLRFSEDGIVSIHLGAQDMGQGHLSTFPALIASRLGIDTGKVRLVAGDSDQTPGIVATVASRSTMMAGSASALACDEAIRRGKLIASYLLEAAEFDIEFKDGAFQVRGTDKHIELLDLPARLLHWKDRPANLPESLNNIATFLSPSLSFPNGCHICEVEVDPETGAVSIVRYTAIDDVGVMLNPTVVEGQVLGGIAQGLGQVLGERLHYDSQGQLMNASFMDYPMPRADTMPPVTLGHHEVPCTNNPLGVKGAGESGVAGSIPSAINAILHALSYRGVKSMDMPFTSNRVWDALSKISS